VAGWSDRIDGTSSGGPPFRTFTDSWKGLFRTEASRGSGPTSAQSTELVLVGMTAIGTLEAPEGSNGILLTVMAQLVTFSVASTRTGKFTEFAM
jgi:hypothetical protein